MNTYLNIKIMHLIIIVIFFSIIKNTQAQSNNELDTEYFQIITKDTRSGEENSRLENISKEREENANIVARLLEKIESN